MKLPFYLYPIRTLCRFFRDLDGLFSILTSSILPHKYEIEGQCKKRGVCCQQIALYLAPAFWKYSLLKGLARTWYEFVYNFTCIGESKENKVVIFKCNYLKGTKCGIYWRRPAICRNYPLVRFFDKPSFLPGCGYRVKPDAMP